MSSTYSFIDTSKNKVIFPSVPNAGLYNDTDNFSGKPWGNDYIEKVEPTAEAYAAKFYAKNHIPSSLRPGNNPKPHIYDYINTEKLNIQCYNL